MTQRSGVLILTEARSGSNWLGSLATQAGLGRAGEWLHPANLGRKLKDHDADTWFGLALDRASTPPSTPRGIFHLKLFPRHLYLMHRHYSVDFIRWCQARHDTGLIAVKRRDRLLQAISFARGIQTQKWHSARPAQGAEVYDFALICKCLFHIGRSYEFWDSYCAARGLDVTTFWYEDLLGDPQPYLAHVARITGQPAPTVPVSEFQVQRDDVTEAWRARFAQDAQTHDLLPHGTSWEATTPPVWAPVAR